MRCVGLAALLALLRLVLAGRLVTVSWGRDRRLAEGDELQVAAVVFWGSLDGYHDMMDMEMEMEMDI